MPHGGYHGTVVMGGNIIQQGDGQGGIQGGLGQAALNIPVNKPAQTAAEATAAAQAKKKEIQSIIDSQTPEAVDVEQGFFFPSADDLKAQAQQLNFQNQQLNNLLIAEQQAKNREGIIRAAEQGVLNASDLTGTTDGPFGLNIPFLGAKDTTISGIGNVINEFTGEKLPAQIKAREGLTTPQYNTFISDLYSANPELYQETFPFASGQIAKPLLLRIGEGIMGLPGASQIGQLASSVISPLSGLFTGQTPGSTYEELLQQYGRPNLIPENLLVPPGDAQGVDKFGNPVLPMGQYSSVPEEYMQGFMDSPFYKSVPGGAAITYVTLPDGREIKFGDTGSASQFRQYLESIGVMQPESTEDFKQVKSQPTGLPALADYASMAPQFTGSQYTNQGVSPAFLENLRRFYG